MDKVQTPDEKRHHDIINALLKIAGEISALKSELTTLRHTIVEATKHQK